MIMRVTWGKIKPGQWDRFEQLWNQHAQETTPSEGLLARWLLRDGAQQDAGYALSLWQSAAAFEAYERDRPRYPDMEECFVGQYVTTPCEVRGAEVAQLLSQSSMPANWGQFTDRGEPTA
jgi:heme-degrading monooxygenase HmoA